MIIFLEWFCIRHPCPKALSVRTFLILFLCLISFEFRFFSDISTFLLNLKLILLLVLLSHLSAWNSFSAVFLCFILFEFKLLFLPYFSAWLCLKFNFFFCRISLLDSVWISFLFWSLSLLNCFNFYFFISSRLVRHPMSLPYFLS